MSAALKSRGDGLWPASGVECGWTRLSHVKDSTNECLLSVETEIVSQPGVSQKRYSQLYNGLIVSDEGFTQKTTASVATENCLRSGGHLTAL